jgi:CheY-like chemotaxis protein
MQEKPLTIIVVDDEEVIRFSLQKKLSRLGYNVISLESEDALYILSQAMSRLTSSYPTSSSAKWTASSS